MLYTVIRLVFALAAGGIAFVICSEMRDSYAAGRRRFIRSDTGVWTGTAVTALLVMLLLSLLPVENAFLGFDKSEDAFRYNHTASILEINEFDDCALVVASTGDERVTTHVLPRRADGKWQLETLWNRRRKVSAINYCLVERLYVPHSENCFVTVARSASAGDSIADDPSSVTDSCGTRFQVVSYPDTMTFFYGYVPAMDDDYALFVNGEKVM